MSISERSEDEIERLEDAAVRALLDDGDRLVLDQYASARRTRARSRLLAVSDWRTHGGSGLFATAAEAAQHAGMSRSGFFLLLERMRAPSLAGLGLRGAGEPPSRRSPADLDAEIAEAARLIAANPNAGTQELIEKLGARVGARAARTTLLRRLDGARSDPAAAGPVGRMMAFDSVSLDLIDPTGRRQRLYVAIETGGGLVLGWRVEAEGAFERGYRIAAERALANLHGDLGHGLRGCAAVDGAIIVEVAIPRTESVFLRERLQGLKAGGAPWNFVVEPRRIGRRAIEAVGAALGGVALSAGQAPPGVVHRNRARRALPVATPAALDALDEALRAHDQRRLSILSEGDGEPFIERAVEILREMAF